MSVKKLAKHCIFSTGLDRGLGTPTRIFRMSYRVLRNAQDFAKEQPMKLLDRRISSMLPDLSSMSLFDAAESGYHGDSIVPRLNLSVDNI